MLLCLPPQPCAALPHEAGERRDIAVVATMFVVFATMSCIAGPCKHARGGPMKVKAFRRPGTHPVWRSGEEGLAGGLRPALGPSLCVEGQ